MDLLIGFCLVIVGIYIALLPSCIAVKREHKNSVPIFICNIVGLFTGVFWVVALIWAFMDNK